MAIRTPILFITVMLAIVFGASCSGGADDAGGEVQNNRHFGAGIGITSPLIDCSLETGCKSFPDLYPALYVQVVSARSFVIGLAADEIEAPATIASQIVLKSQRDRQPPMIESTGHSRLSVGFDESNNAHNELRIHVLLKAPMVRNQSYSVSVATLPPMTFTYPADFISPSVQVNQLGYLPNADKRAFAGNWLGTSGPMPVDHVNFKVISTDNGQVVFQGLLELVASRDAWSGNTVYRADFSEVNDEGEYVLSVAGLGHSQAFEISRNVFKPAFEKTFRLFYHSRNSIVIRAPWADPGYERSAGISEDLTARIHPAVVTSVFADNEEADSYQKVGRGWFDAGDYGQYVANVAPVWHAFGVGMDLMPAFFSSDDFNLPESNNGIPDIIDELEWGMDWLLAMQNPRNGGVYSRSVPVLWDEALPQDVTKPRYIFEITSHATASFAAMAAIHSRLIAKWKPERAAIALAASRSAWEFLERTEQWPAESESYKNPKNVHAGEYADDSATDNRMWAAAELYRATGEANYKTAFVELFRDIKIDPTERVSFKHQSMAAFWSMYRALQEHKPNTNTASAEYETGLLEELAKILINAADWYLRKADEHPFDAPVHHYMKYTGWGSFAHSSRAIIPLMQAWSITGKQDYCRRSAAMTNPQLGANPQSLSYITGLGKRSPRYPLSLLSRFDTQAAPLNGIPVNGPHYHLPAIWPSTRAVNDSYIPANNAKDGTMEAYKIYPPLRRYVDSNLLPPMSEPTVAEYALTAVAFGLLSDGNSLCVADR